MRVIFPGSGEFGLPTLKRLAQEHEVAAVVTQPDRPAGRGRRLTPTPIAQWAQGAGLPVMRARDANDSNTIQALADLKADAGVVVAFGQKLSPQLIGALGKLTVNLHASLLPKYRGAAPINWAIMEGERETGVSVIGLAQRMDGGEVYATAATAIDPMETAGELHDRLAAMGPDVVLKVLAELEAGQLSPVKQDETLATRAPKLSKADGWVDFNVDAQTVRRRVHGLTPWPGVTVTWRSAVTGEERQLKLLRVDVVADCANDKPAGRVLEGGCVATGSGAVRLVSVQLPGGKAMTWEAFAAGHAMKAGDELFGASPA